MLRTRLLISAVANSNCLTRGSRTYLKLQLWLLQSFFLQFEFCRLRFCWRKFKRHTLRSVSFNLLENYVQSFFSQSSIYQTSNARINLADNTIGKPFTNRSVLSHFIIKQVHPVVMETKFFVTNCCFRAKCFHWFFFTQATWIENDIALFPNWKNFRNLLDETQSKILIKICVQPS